jgi:hypothetical protein
MATSFPTSLDSLSNPEPGTRRDVSGALGHSTQHTNVNDAIEAIEAKVGVDDSAVTTSLDYRVGALEDIGLVYAQTVASAALSGNTSTANFDQTYTLPANTFAVGTVVTINFGGIVTAVNGSDDIDLSVFVGFLTALGVVNTVPVVNGTFTGQVNILCRTAGVSGTCTIWGHYKLPDTTSQNGGFIGYSVPSSGSFDTTISKLIAVGAAWSSASGGNSVRLDMMTVEVKK